MLFLVLLTEFSRAVAIPGSCTLRSPEFFLEPSLFSLAHFSSGVHGDNVPGAAGSSAHPWVAAMFICSNLSVCKDGFKQISASVLPAD